MEIEETDQYAFSVKTRKEFWITQQTDKVKTTKELESKTNKIGYEETKEQAYNFVAMS